METINYQFILPGEVRLQRGEGRRLVARLLHHAPHAERLFNYHAGKPITGSPERAQRLRETGLAKGDAAVLIHNMAAYPAVRFFARQNVLDIVALTAESGEVLDEHAMSIARALKNEFGAPAQLRRDEVECNIYLSESRVWRYKVHDMVLLRDARRFAAFVDKSKEEQNVIVRDKIIRGIELQARFMGLEPPDLADDVREVEFSRVIAMPAITKKGEPGQTEQAGLAVSDLTFISNHRISGPWAAGHLTSRGHGRIWFARGGIEGAA